MAGLLPGTCLPIAVLFGLPLVEGVAVGSTAVSWNAGAPAAARILVQEPTGEERLRTLTRDLVRGTRRLLRRSYRLVTRSLSFWGRWLRQASFSLLVVLFFLLVDRPLLAAWRRHGIGVLVENIPLMLYVHLRLLFTLRVAPLAKVLLALAIVYGVKRLDLVSDRTLIPGRIDDIVILGLATRAFVRACPEETVQRYAAEAVGWRVRIKAIRRREA